MVVDDQAEYTAVVDVKDKLGKSEVDKHVVNTLSDGIAIKAKSFTSNSMRLRMLLQITEAVETYADQQSVECAESDVGCTSFEAEDGDVPTSTTQAPTNINDCKDGSCCGVGTAFKNGRCYPTYEGMVAACKAARGNWGWTCESTCDASH
jgi:hypothetical protein